MKKNIIRYIQNNGIILTLLSVIYVIIVMIFSFILTIILSIFNLPDIVGYIICIFCGYAGGHWILFSINNSDNRIIDEEYQK